MKHFSELTENERQKFADELSDDLEVFFKNAREKYGLCNTCLHNAVMLMCENFVEEQEAMPSDAKH
jgi:hypothetical protein